MECKMIGALENSSDVIHLDDLLMALSFARKREVERIEIRMVSSPSQGAPGDTITLLQEKSPPSSAVGGPWHVKHEGPPKIRDRGMAKESEVTFREVSSSICEGAMEQLQAFWKALGFSVSYQLKKTGNEYCCMCKGYDLNVLFTGISFEGILKKSFYLVEVSTRATKQDYNQAGEAVLEFAEKLKPFVHLTRAADVFQRRRPTV